MGIGAGSGLDIDAKFGIGAGSGLDIDAKFGIGADSGLDIDAGLGVGVVPDIDARLGIGIELDSDARLTVFGAGLDFCAALGFGAALCACEGLDSASESSCGAGLGILALKPPFSSCASTYDHAHVPANAPPTMNEPPDAVAMVLPMRKPPNAARSYHNSALCCRRAMQRSMSSSLLLGVSSLAYM